MHLRSAPQECPWCAAQRAHGAFPLWKKGLRTSMAQRLHERWETATLENSHAKALFLESRPYANLAGRLFFFCSFVFGLGLSWFVGCVVCFGFVSVGGVFGLV